MFEDFNYVVDERRSTPHFLVSVTFTVIRRFSGQPKSAISKAFQLR